MDELRQEKVKKWEGMTLKEWLQEGWPKVPQPEMKDQWTAEEAVRVAEVMGGTAVECVICLKPFVAFQYDHIPEGYEYTCWCGGKVRWLLEEPLVVEGSGEVAQDCTERPG